MKKAEIQKIIKRSIARPNEEQSDRLALIEFFKENEKKFSLKDICNKTGIPYKDYRKNLDPTKKRLSVASLAEAAKNLL